MEASEVPAPPPGAGAVGEGDPKTLLEAARVEGGVGGRIPYNIGSPPRKGYMDSYEGVLS